MRVFGARGRLLDLGPGGVADMVVLGLLGALAEISIRLRPLPQVARWFGLRLEGDPTLASGWKMTERQRRRRRIIEMLMRHWPVGDREGLCLRRALLIGWVLRDRDPLLRIGLERRDGEINAHAWLEVEGRTLGKQGPYRPFALDDPSASTDHGHHLGAGAAEHAATPQPAHDPLGPPGRPGPRGAGP